MAKLPIIFPILSLFLFIISIIIFQVLNKKRFFESENRKFTFRNHLPFEQTYLRKFDNFKFAIFALVIIGVFAICSSIEFFLIFLNQNDNLVFAITCSAFFIFSTFEVICLFVTNPNNLKTFKIVYSFSYLFIIMSVTMLSILAICLREYNVWLLILGIIGIFLIIVDFIFVLNPKIKNWVFLEKKLENDQTVTYIRPKINYFALSIWINIIIFIIGVIILNLFVLIASL